MLIDLMMQGLATLTTNPVLTDVLGGLAASATAFAAVERMLLWNMRNATVEPFGETVQQVFARISALRDSLDGPQVTTLGLPCESRHLIFALSPPQHSRCVA